MITDRTVPEVRIDCDGRYDSHFKYAALKGTSHKTRAELAYDQDIIRNCRICGYKTESGYEYCNTCLSRSGSPHPDFISI